MTDVLGEPDLTTLTPGPIDQAAAGVGVAVLVRVRAGRNKDFDRLVFDFEGPTPGVITGMVAPALIGGLPAPGPSLAAGGQAAATVDAPARLAGLLCVLQSDIVDVDQVHRDYGRVP